MNTPLSNIDLKNFIQEADISDPNVIETAKLHNEQHMFHNRGHVILFHKWKQNDDIGHWIPIVRNEHGDAIMFCSYGTQPAQIKGLTEALRDEGVKHLFVNDKQYQSNESAVCGRYSLFVIGCNKMGLNIDQIQQLLENGKKQFGSYDKFIMSLF